MPPGKIAIAPDAPPRPRQFRRRDRLSHALEFQAVYNAQIRQHRGPLVIYALPNDLGRHRLGLSVGRRVGNAVKRNRIKRLLREAFRLHAPHLPGSYDLVINVRPHALMPLATYEKLFLGAAADLHKLWKKRLANDPATRAQLSQEQS